MFFTSDNAAPAHPAIMDAMLSANTGYTSGYGAEDAMTSVQQSIRDLFEAPNAAVFLVSTGTAANALALATITKPWETIFCHRNAPHRRGRMRRTRILRQRRKTHLG